MRCSSIPDRRPTWWPSRHSPRRDWATAGCGPATRSSRWPPASQHGRPDRAERPGTGVRRRAPGRLQRRPRRVCAPPSASAPARSCSRTRWACPFDLDVVMGLVEEHDLWLVEDNCDALGSRYRDRLTGTFGHIATSSFYPAHHITTGEGGMVVTDDEELARIARSVRDWGRDCYCAGGENNTCGKRFSQQFGSTASRLRPQVRLQPSRLQPEGDGHAGGDRLCPAAPPRRVRGRAPGQPRSPA